MAMMVCRVTPTRSASCACVISPCANRRARIEFVTFVGLTPELVVRESSAPSLAVRLRRVAADQLGGEDDPGGWLAVDQVEQ